MAIYIDKSSRVIIQGITGRIGRIFAERMAQHYPNFVGGVTPGKGGQEVFGKPVYDDVETAVSALNANTSVIVVAAPFMKGAVFEAIDAGIKTIWCYTDRVPVHETLEMVQYAKLSGVTLIGPNSAGIVSPGKASAGELNENYLPLKEGSVGLLSKSGSLSYEVINLIADAGFGFSTIICIGGDPVLGTSCCEAMAAFKNDPETKAVVMLGEVGGTDEIDAIEIIREMDKPVVAYIAGHCAPAKKKMGHAGAIVNGTADTADAKTAALRAAGVHAVNAIDEIPQELNKLDF
ncbi:succinate--CoA ligase subunit alpha [Bacilliculturomica massiliensis]|uniref:succinate--CoA ligase subunit alpha n=1 Tax=Bacilliculturomica massiliensis TaxID=1917867 RepID=UPI00103250E3|nr:CoA-binding protein [Bacilliculturomica massiliensis]